MKFVKDNAFIIGTVVVMLAAWVMTWVFSRSNNAESRKNIARYERLSEELASLSASGVSPDMVLQAKRRVEQMRKLAEEIAQAFLQKNRDNYDVITLDVSGKKIPIFPVDPKFKDRETLRLLFPSEYRSRVEKLLKSLRPTVPPTAEEIAQEAARIAASMVPEPTETGGSVKKPAGSALGGLGRRPSVLERASRGREYRTGFPRAAGFEAGAPRPLERGRGLAERREVLPSRIGRGGIAGGKVSPVAGKAIPPSAQEIAIRKLRLVKAARGWIYADKQSMYEADMSDAERYDDAELFMKQVSLWVQQDIVNAINLTNDQVRKGAGRFGSVLAGGDSGVPSSAVRQLLSINVRGFVVGQSGAGGSGPTPYGRGPKARGELRREIGFKATGATTSSLRYILPGGQAITVVPALTGRRCNKLYDVVHYDFTVLMPVRYLPLLYKNILSENFHTILDVRIDNPRQVSGGTSASSGGAFSRGAEQLYYYGDESVMRVNIVGEMILLTDWTRGRWDAKERRWDKDLPPLMPVDVLKQIAQVSPDAMRAEDEKRIKAASPANVPGMSPFGGAGRFMRWRM